MKFRLILVIAVMLATGSALAASEKKMTPEWFKSDISLVAKPGTVKSADDGIPSRSMVMYSVDALLGYRLAMSGNYLTFGVDPQYAFVRQLRDPAEVSNSNMYGTAWIIGAGAGYEFGQFSVFGSYDFLSTYKLGQKTSSGKEVVYSKPTGFRFMANYKAWENVFISANFGLDSYKQVKTGDVTSTLSANKLKVTTYGLGIGYSL